MSFLRRVLQGPSRVSLRCFCEMKPSVADPNETLDKKRARLLYQSRYRGILENDIVLGGFAESQLKNLDAKGLQEYDELINGNHNEWDIWYWVAGAKKIPDNVNTDILQKIINHAWTSNKIYWYQKEQLKVHPN